MIDSKQGLKTGLKLLGPVIQDRLHNMRTYGADWSAKPVSHAMVCDAMELSWIGLVGRHVTMGHWHDRRQRERHHPRHSIHSVLQLRCHPLLINCRSMKSFYIMPRSQEAFSEFYTRIVPRCSQSGISCAAPRRNRGCSERRRMDEIRNAKTQKGRQFHEGVPANQRNQ